MLIFRWTDKLKNSDDPTKDIHVAHDLALVDILKLLANGDVNQNTGMIEAEQDVNGRFKVIPIQHVKRAAHLIPTGTAERYYINNYIDLEMYNLVY
jgi:hypothetical protein